MKQTQWLLIGGEGHGRTLWIKGGTTVLFPMKHGYANQRYEGGDYYHDGKFFQLGLHNPTPDQRDEIPALIAETKLSPLDAV